MLISILALCLLGFLLVFSVWHAYKVSKEMDLLAEEYLNKLDKHFKDIEDEWRKDIEKRKDSLKGV